jgi:predicted transposase YdaD
MLGLGDLKQSRVYQEALQEGQREIVEALLKARFGNLDAELSAIVPVVLKRPSVEFTPLLLQLSREELLDRFRQES